MITIIQGGLIVKEKTIILNREEVMETLKIGRGTFYKLIHDGVLKRIQRG